MRMTGRTKQERKEERSGEGENMADTRIEQKRPEPNSEQKILYSEQVMKRQSKVHEKVENKEERRAASFS